MNITEGDSSEPEITNYLPPRALEHQDSFNGNQVIKSGALLLSSRGIGWTSWKKRWFVLTQTSLVFLRCDPNVVLPNGSEVNCTLGGIDLNSSSSVVINEDKKLITVQFPDGQDGHTFTLKAETLEELLEWKVALQEALENAPSAAPSMGQNGILNNDQENAADVVLDQSKGREPVKSMVIGQPLLLALEDIDGTPSFLEKALRFVEEQGVKVEGILRQAADVEDVEQRIREYEQGKTEFSSEEDGHVIADCVKYILRELPSSPVPASCCNALVESCRTDRKRRLSAMRNAICETFPEPNRRLLQRILTMMRTIAAHEAQNRMSVSAVAACMAPLLLRPLLSGECELQQNFDENSDSSAQLLQAAAAANNARAICINLLEEYDNLFGVGTVMPELYSETDVSGSEIEELTEDGETTEGGSDYDATDGSDGTEDDRESESVKSSSRSDVAKAPEPDQKLTLSPNIISDNMEKDGDSNKDQSNDNMKAQANGYSNQLLAGPPSSSIYQKSANLVKGIAQSARRPALWGRSGESESSQSSSRSDVANAPEPDQKLALIPKAISNNINKDGDGKKNQSNDNLKAQANDHNNQSSADPPSSSVYQKSAILVKGLAQSARRPVLWGRPPGKKSASMDSIDLRFEKEAEIRRLQATKLELQNRIAEEAKGNKLLLDRLERRKNSLLERRLILEKDVGRLQEQLDKERILSTSLETGLKSQGQVPAPALIDKRTMKTLEDIDQADVVVSHLKQKADDLETQPNQHRDQNSRLQQKADIQRLWATKLELQNRIAEEAKGNERLLHRLKKRNHSLHKRRLILEKDVGRLQEQLDKARRSSTSLEAGLKSQGQVPAPDLIDKRTMKTLEDIDQADVVVSNLKQKADDLETQPNQHRDQNSTLQQKKVEPKDVDSAAASNANEKATRRKRNTDLIRAETDNEKKQEAGISRAASTNSKKSGPGGEI